MSVRKKFDRNLYQKNDPHKEVVLSHLRVEEHAYWHVNPDRYGPDLQTIWDDQITEYAEIEVKQHWRGGAIFPFPTLQIPSRKEKWLDLWLKFWILSADREYAISVGTDVLIEHSTRQIVPNRYVRYGETFIVVPVGMCEIIKLRGDQT